VNSSLTEHRWFTGIAMRRTISIISVGIVAVLYAGAAILELVPGAGWYFDRRFFRELLACDTKFPTLEAAVDSPRSFHGDGFSVARYTLSPELDVCVTNLARQQQALPTTMRDRLDWSIRQWRRAPLTSLDSGLVEWALHPEGKELSDEIRASLAHGTTWYAILYKGNVSEDDLSGHIANVDLFVVDRIAGKLYILNLNT
jgi:hypothetical protein